MGANMSEIIHKKAHEETADTIIIYEIAYSMYSMCKLYSMYCMCSVYSIFGTYSVYSMYTYIRAAMIYAVNLTCRCSCF